MIAFQIILGLIIVTIVYKVIVLYQKKSISSKVLGMWILFWLLALYILVKPDVTTTIAHQLGIGRGVDLAIYISLVVIFYLIFRIFVRIDKIEKNTSKIVEKIAINSAKSKQ